MRAAVVQLNSTDDYENNLAVAERLVRAAAAEGADLVVLPEKWTVIGPPETLTQYAEPLDGNAISGCRELCRELGINLVAGSFPERVPGREKISNTSVLIGPDGGFRGIYRKIHLFDVDVEATSYRESEVEEAGDEIVTGEVEGVPVGLTICYDLRFPELFRILALRGARIITVPSAFTERTGRDHWEPLLRARAIENQVFIVAAAQIGDAPPNYKSYGRSVIIDPWGVVMTQAPDTEWYATADLDFPIQEEMRRSIPVLSQRRPDVYRWPEAGA
jgi:predicted amidohydrolase